MNDIEKKIFKLITDSETTLYPSRSKAKWDTVISILGVITLFLVDTFIIIPPSSNFHTIKYLIYLGLVVSGCMAIYKSRSSAFSIRLNIFGMVVTNFSKNTWFRWDTIHDVKTWHNESGVHIVFKADEQLDANWVQDFTGGGYTFLPRNYELPDETMIELMNSYKAKYDQMNLQNYPKLEFEAMKVPPIMFLWGRLGAKNSSP